MLFKEEKPRVEKPNGIVDEKILSNTILGHPVHFTKVFSIKVDTCIWAPEPTLYKKINTDFLMLSSKMHICHDMWTCTFKNKWTHKCMKDDTKRLNNKENKCVLTEG